MDPGSYHDCGHGVFFALDEDWRSREGGSYFGELADSLSATPNLYYGPAAWSCGVGPVSAELLLRVGKMPDFDGEFSRASPFPGSIAVSKAGIIAGLEALHGRTVADLSELLDSVDTLLLRRGSEQLKVYPAEDRLQRCRDLMPGIL